jgi:hypothetical protein
MNSRGPVALGLVLIVMGWSFALPVGSRVAAAIPQVGRGNALGVVCDPGSRVVRSLRGRARGPQRLLGTLCAT